MENNFLQYSGWAIALLSLIVNILQLMQNNSLRKKIQKTKQKHSGTGDNINVGGNYNQK